jgi:hypothetical protein
MKEISSSVDCLCVIKLGLILGSCTKKLFKIFLNNNSIFAKLVKNTGFLSYLGIKIC